MNSETVLHKLLDIVNSNLTDENFVSDEFDMDLSIMGMDSIKFIQIIVSIEETFGIEVPDEKLLITEMGTVNKMLDVILFQIENYNMLF